MKKKTLINTSTFLKLGEYQNCFIYVMLIYTFSVIENRKCYALVLFHKEITRFVLLVIGSKGKYHEVERCLNVMSRLCSVHVVPLGPHTLWEP